MPISKLRSWQRAQWHIVFRHLCVVGVGGLLLFIVHIFILEGSGSYAEGLRPLPSSWVRWKCTSYSLNWICYELDASLLPGEDQGTECATIVPQDPGCSDLRLGYMPRPEVVVDELAVHGRVSSLTLNVGPLELL